MAYDIVQTVLNAARIRLNDAIQTPAGAPTGQIGGEVLNDNTPFTLPLVNAAWQRLQEFLVSIGYLRLVNDAILSIPAVGTSDAGLLCSLGFSGYFNGVSLAGSPALPPDLISPLRLWERATGSTGQASQFTPMEFVQNGLSDTLKRNRNYNWGWQNDSVTFPGATIGMDLRIRYAAYLPDFATVVSPPLDWWNQPVPIMRCLDAFAWYICSEMANARGDLDGAAFDTKAEAAAMKLQSKDSQIAKQRGEWTVPDIPTQTGNTPYDIVSTILNASRVRLNKASTVAGDVVSAASPFCQQYFNTAWRRLQEFLVSQGSPRFTGEAFLTVPAVGTSDPAAMCSLSWAGYFDGVTQHLSPALPNDFIAPLRMWERSDSDGLGYTPMEFNVNGLQDQVKGTRNYAWEWREDAIYFPGATQTMDLRVRYAAYLADFAENGATPWYLSQVPIARSLDALSLFVCVEVANARPDLELDVVAYQSQAETAAKMLLAKDSKLAELRGEWVIPDIPPASAGAYDVVSTILNASRVRLNVASKAAGDVVTASQPFSQQAFNTAWRNLQQFLANAGFKRLESEAIVTTPSTETTDPGIMCYLGRSGFFNGVILNSAVTLPGDLISPLRVWERVFGSTGQAAQFTPMENVLDGLTDTPKRNRNYNWEWREDAIYLPGAVSGIDLRIRYAATLADFSQSGSTPWYMAQVPIARCLDSLSLYFCVEIARARPDLGLDSAAYRTEAEAAAMKLVTIEQEAQAKRAEWTVPDIPSASGDTPYDYVTTILNTARVRLNRAAKASGDVISAASPFAQQYFNTAWRRLQEFLASANSPRFTGETVLTVTPTATADPSVMCYLAWNGYFNGVSASASPTLPNDLIFPLRVWERQNGSSGESAQFTPMEFTVNGLQDAVKRDRSYSWEWREDALFFPGATISMDMRIRYAAYLPDFIENGTDPWYVNTVPISRCLDALSLYICAEVALARPDFGLDAAQLRIEAEAAAKILAERDSKTSEQRAQWIIPEIPSQKGNTPYDDVNTLLSVTRVRLNAANKLAGDILSAPQPFTQQFTNTAWRKFQEYLANLGYIKLTEEVILTNLAPTQATDPSVQTVLDWDGYFNGTTGASGAEVQEIYLTKPVTNLAPLSQPITGDFYYVVVTTDSQPGRQIVWDPIFQGIKPDQIDNAANQINIYSFIARGDGNWWCFDLRLGMTGAPPSPGLKLPSNLMFPLRLWERQTGQNGLFCPMECILDGLPTIPFQAFNRIWEWRNDSIVLPGATGATDLRIRYAAYLSDFVQVGATPWFLSTIPIARCVDALSFYVCAEVARARPDLEMDPEAFQVQAESAAKLIYNRDVRMKQRTNVRRRSRSGRLEQGTW